MTAIYLPHIDMLLQALRISRERLGSKSKIAIDARLLRTLLQTLAAQAPFDAAFYRGQYPDLAAAEKAGHIADLHQHYYESGFFEGRLGAEPEVDEGYYTSLYHDVGDAVASGDVQSGQEHYLRSGASEGRVPNAALLKSVESWMQVLRDDGGRG